MDFCYQMAKKKKQGHYCRICGERKANEKFSGKGHANHICKECDALPQEKKNELRRLDQISKIAEKYPRSRKDWELLEKYSKSNKYPEAMEFAKMILGMNSKLSSEDSDDLKDRNEDMNEFFLHQQLYTFSELDNDLKEDVSFVIYEIIEDFIRRKEYVPEEKDKQKMLDEICTDVSSGYGQDIMPDKELNCLFDTTLKDIIGNLEKEGVKPVSYYQSLVVMKTERLTIRKFVKDDLTILHSIMEKPEVMYAWEHGFSKSETRKWLNRQLTRYKKDGYGYFAVFLKGTDKLIGQVGLLKNEISGKEVVELGYVFDNLYWGQGYCMEVVEACLRFAFDKLKLDNLYCSIRPNNISSIQIAEKTGMIKIGEHIVNYRNHEMPHVIYILEQKER